MSVVEIDFRGSLRHRGVVLEVCSRLGLHGKPSVEVNANASVVEIVSLATSLLQFAEIVKRSAKVCSPASDAWT